jgi:thiamine pyrophosphate-dependent acetolactate synthase large subunit-like protein
VDRVDQLQPALDRAKAERNVPIVIDFRVPTEENVFPMIPSGKTYADLILKAKAREE